MCKKFEWNCKTRERALHPQIAPRETFWIPTLEKRGGKATIDGQTKRDEVGGALMESTNKSESIWNNGTQASERELASLRAGARQIKALSVSGFILIQLSDVLTPSYVRLFWSSKSFINSSLPSIQSQTLVEVAMFT